MALDGGTVGLTYCSHPSFGTSSAFVGRRMVGCGSAPLLQGCVSNSADRQGQSMLQRNKKAEAAFLQQEHFSR